MILYTVYDVESVLSTADTTPSALENAMVGGVPVLIRRAKEGAASIERVLSTDPNDYLRPELTPGTPVVFRDHLS